MFAQHHADSNYINTVMFFSIQNTTINIPINLNLENITRQLSTLMNSNVKPHGHKLESTIVELKGQSSLTKKEFNEEIDDSVLIISGTSTTTKSSISTPLIRSFNSLSVYPTRTYSFKNSQIVNHTNQEADCKKCIDCIHNYLRDSDEDTSEQVMRKRRCTFPSRFLNKSFTCGISQFSFPKNDNKIHKRDVKNLEEYSEELTASHYSGTCFNNSLIPIKDFIGKNCNKVINLSVSSNGVCISELKCPKNKVLQENFCSPRDKIDFFFNFCSTNEFHFSLLSIHFSNDFDFIDESICSIRNISQKLCNGLKRKEYRKLSIIKLNGEYKQVTKPHFFQFDPDKKSILNYKCKVCKNDACLRCDGDSTYKEHISRDKSNPCYCEFDGKTVGLTTMFIGGEKIPVEEMYSEMLLIEYEYEKEIQVKPKPQNCKDCIIECVGNMVSLKLISHDVNYFKFCSRTSCYLTNNAKQVLLPPAMLLIETVVEAKMFDNNNNLILMKEFQCEVSNQCMLINCKLCMENLLNIDCYDNLDKIILLISAILLTLFLSFISKLLIIFYIIGRFVVLFMKILTYLVKTIRKITYCLRGYKIEEAKRIRTRKYEENGELVELIVEENTNIQTSRTPSQRHRDYLQSMKIDKLIFSILIMIVILHETYGCTTLSTNILKESSCIQIQKGKLNCKNDEKISLLLPGFGGDSCLLLRSAAGTIIGSMKIKINNIKARCIQSQLYFTYQPILKKITSCHCWPSKLCTEEYCFNYNGTQVHDGLMLDNPNVPNKSLCKKIDSDWFGSCIISSSSCCYSQLAFNVDDSSIYKLQKCLSFYWEVDLEVKMFSNDKNVALNSSVQAGTKATNAIGEFMLTSISEPLVSDKLKCIMTKINDNTDSLVDCSNIDEHVKGKIGEIRCEQSPIKNSKNCFLAPDLIKDRIQGFNLVLDAEILDINKIHVMNKIPLSRITYDFKKDSKGFYFNNPRYSVFKLQINLNEFLVSNEDRLVDCSFNFISLKGCHSCPIGGQLLIKSTCSDYPNLAFLKCNHGPETPFIISNSDEIKVRFTSNTTKINEECEISVNKYSHKIKIHGILLSDSEDLNVSQVDNVKANRVMFGFVNEDFFRNSTEFIRNLFTYWRSWLVIIIILGIILGLILIRIVFGSSTIARFKQL